MSRGWVMKQLDVKNAIQHGMLKEVVYMEQPPTLNIIDHVCLLNGSLYGFKQAPRAWFDKLSQFL